MRDQFYKILLFLLTATISAVAGFHWQWVRTWEIQPHKQEAASLNEFSATHQIVGEFDSTFVTSPGHPELTSTASLLPQVDSYNIQDLRAVYHYTNTCGNLPNIKDSLLAKTLQWSRYLCRQAKEPDLKFFQAPPYLHPGGGTFAARALSQNISTLSSLQPFLHKSEFSSVDWRSDKGLSETERSIIEVISQENPGTIELLGNQEDWVIGTHYVFHRQQRADQTLYVYYPLNEWQVFWYEKPLQPRSISIDENCDTKNLGLCWYKSKYWLNRTAPFMAFTATALLLGSFIAAVAVYIRRRKQRAKELEERLLLLQILTHELRTPVTSMRLDTDVLRKEISLLSPSGQEAFLRMCSGVQRLMRALSASESYLATFASGGIILDQKQHIPSLQDFIASQIEITVTSSDEESRIFMEPLTQDRSLKLNAEIMGVCLRNLIQNALKHGIGKVKISAHVNNDSLKIAVSDEGAIDPSYIKTHKFTAFQKSSNSQGLGLGLYIVYQFVQRMNGELIVSDSPTTFTISVPLEVKK